ncbi:MAG: sulfur carrier protein ThiS [Clostridiaceae bacterium]|nr:sulfur carrier protein ThiS [Clostridiaceae bacterium]
MIKVNGAEVFDAVGLSLDKYLENSGYIISRVAVELNGKIVSKSLYGQTMLAEGDSLEVVSFVGGG